MRTVQSTFFTADRYELEVQESPRRKKARAWLRKDEVRIDLGYVKSCEVTAAAKSVHVRIETAAGIFDFPSAVRMVSVPAANIRARKMQALGLPASGGAKHERELSEKMGLVPLKLEHTNNQGAGNVGYRAGFNAELRKIEKQSFSLFACGHPRTKENTVFSAGGKKKCAQCNPPILQH